MTSYGFFDGDGNEITRGYQCTEEQAMAFAKRIANERGTCVEVCEEPDVSESLAVVEPD